ncbi:hypothetical protein JCM5353_008260 [Sporobolomyces roseus]
MPSDQTIGRVSLVLLTILYVYYTLWTLLTPLLPSDSPVQSLFPSREWAIKIPVLILLVGFSSVGMIVGWTMIGTGKAKGRGGRWKEGEVGQRDARKKVE